MFVAFQMASWSEIGKLFKTYGKNYMVTKLSNLNMYDLLLLLSIKGLIQHKLFKRQPHIMVKHT